MIVRALALSALSVLAAAPATAQEGIRVGFVTILTGPLAAPGKEMENGIELFLQQQKRTLAGRRVELTVVDSGGQPAGTLARARELVEQRRVRVVLGPLAVFEAYALAPYVNAQHIPTISPSAAADDLTQRKATQFFVRATSTSIADTPADAFVSACRSSTSAAPSRRSSSPSPPVRVPPASTRARTLRVDSSSSTARMCSSPIARRAAGSTATS